MNKFKVCKNPNAEAYKAVAEAIKDNGGYCCCKLEHTVDTQCPCKDFREQTTTGYCHCERYYKVQQFPIITLCGSTRFKDEFLRVQRELTLQGYIVLSVGAFGHADGDIWLGETKQLLDDIHKAKIEMSDAIYVINKDGYIGESTKSEIEWATALGKRIYYL